MGRDNLCVLEAAKCCLGWAVREQQEHLSERGNLCMKMKQLGAHLPLDTAGEYPGYWTMLESPDLP